MVVSVPAYIVHAAVWELVSRVIHRRVSRTGSVGSIGPKLLGDVPLRAGRACTEQRHRQNPLVGDPPGIRCGRLQDLIMEADILAGLADAVDWS